MNRITTGMLTKRDAAAKSPHACPVEEMRLASPTGSVYISLEVLNVRAKSYSFQAARKLNKAVTATAGSESGRTTFQNTWN